jgi:hypothetical protein
MRSRPRHRGKPLGFRLSVSLTLRNIGHEAIVSSVADLILMGRIVVQ